VSTVLVLWAVFLVALGMSAWLGSAACLVSSVRSSLSLGATSVVAALQSAGAVVSELAASLRAPSALSSLAAVIGAWVRTASSVLGKAWSLGASVTGFIGSLRSKASGIIGSVALQVWLSASSARALAWGSSAVLAPVLACLWAFWHPAPSLGGLLSGRLVFLCGLLLCLAVSLGLAEGDAGPSLGLQSAALPAS